MQKQFSIKCTLEKESKIGDLNKLAARELSVDRSEITAVRLQKRSIDARRLPIKVNLQYLAYLNEAVEEPTTAFQLKDVSNAKAVHIIGFGPAGIFAALQLISDGYKPIVFERGKDVRTRRRDLAAINKAQVVNTESNYCYGEGGAGTYSDGKLYSRSKKRGDLNQVFQCFIDFGADENIAIEAHPHIGTNKLPQIITAMREAIIKHGGEVHFDHKLTDITIQENKIKSITLNDDKKIKIDQLILATGHSARDIFQLLYKKDIKIEAQPFALGVRIEHPQQLIDQIQYHQEERSELLPPAAYRIVKQVNGKGVYSFCMCPGGIIAPCATNKGEIVTNGWSPSRRNNPFANSGIVVSIEKADWLAYEKYGPLAAMMFQADVEQNCFNAVNKNGEDGQLAPAQRMIDFVKGKPSKDLPNCSYIPGIVPARLDQILPAFVANRLRKAFELFGKSMKGYLTNEAVVVGVESRTSSPVGIPRNRENMQHETIENLYPVGEGAGYAGGIASAAIDGKKAAAAIAKKFVA